MSKGIFIHWEEVRPHRKDPSITVKEGSWHDVEEWGYNQFNEYRKIKAYLQDGKIIASVLLRPDYDPCGRTDWIIDDEWSSE